MIKKLRFVMTVSFINVCIASFFFMKLILVDHPEMFMTTHPAHSGPPTWGVTLELVFIMTWGFANLLVFGLADDRLQKCKKLKKKKMAERQNTRYLETVR